VTPTQRKGAPDRERNGILRNLTPSDSAVPEAVTVHG
jgi:hypothetical protein